MEDIKSKFKVIQAVGRTLRLHESKKMAYVYDVVDKVNKLCPREKKDGSIMYYVQTSIAYNHYKVRKKHYEQEGYKHKIWDFIKASDFEKS